MAPGLIRVLAAVALLCVAACGGPARAPDAAPEDAPGVQLSASEVRAVFIGKPWQTDNGTYHFHPNGTYTYRSSTTTLAIGPLPYTLGEDGVLRTSTNSFTFFRIGAAYRYYNANSRQYFLARMPADG